MICVRSKSKDGSTRLLNVNNQNAMVLFFVTQLIFAYSDKSGCHSVAKFYKHWQVVVSIFVSSVTLVPIVCNAFGCGVNKKDLHVEAT
jgi:predicted Na+-dependent transporter